MIRVYFYILKILGLNLFYLTAITDDGHYVTETFYQ